MAGKERYGGATKKPMTLHFYKDENRISVTATYGAGKVGMKAYIHYMGQGSALVSLEAKDKSVSFAGKLSDTLNSIDGEYQVKGGASGKWFVVSNPHQLLLGRWSGKVGDNLLSNLQLFQKENIVVGWITHRFNECGKGFKDYAKEKVSVKFFQGNIVIKGVRYEFLGGRYYTDCSMMLFPRKRKKTFYLDTYYGLFDSLNSMSGTYTDTKGNKGAWSFSR